MAAMSAQSLAFVNVKSGNNVILVVVCAASSGEQCRSLESILQTFISISTLAELHCAIIATSVRGSAIMASCCIFRREAWGVPTLPRQHSNSGQPVHELLYRAIQLGCNLVSVRWL